MEVLKMKGSGTDQSTCDYRFLYNNDFYTMTCLVYSKNNDYFCIAADTWNTTKDDNKVIHKIVFNKNNKIIVGCVGQNSTEYKHLEDRLKDFQTTISIQLRS